jgi:hypothetical protein
MILWWIVIYFKVLNSHTCWSMFDAPLNSLINSISSWRWKQRKDKKLGYIPWLATFGGVEGHTGALRWELRRVTSKSIIHMDLHKPNNKLASAYDVLLIP